MTNHGDDCYFFYYSTCSKGDSCPFRHCEAAMGIETVCNLWQEGRCFRTVCKFRHMEITKNRKEIACYWEHQPAGCQKPHCAFSHDKGRYIDGVYLPPNKCQVKNQDIKQEEPAPPPAAPLPTANPQLRGVKKAETLETVPSPTHPPVVVTCIANDDEDEDDQISEEGEEGKVSQDGSRVISPRKLPGGNHSDQSLNFGVSTLQEIRLRKNLKANLKKGAHPVQTSDALGNGVNTQSSFQPVLYEASNAPVVFEESGRPRGSVAERLGRKIHTVTGADSTLLRSSLAGRLGNIVEEEVAPSTPQKALKSVKERLCLPDEPDALMPNALSAENNMASNRAPEQIHIKTLEEIRKEKAAKLQSLSDSASDTSTTNAVSTKATRGTRREVTVGDAPVGIKTLSELLHAKKRRQEEQQKQEQVSDPKKPKRSAENVPGKTAGEPGTCDDVAKAGAEVRVKTLEEIRREKAAKTQTQQAQQAHEVENRKNAAEESSAKRPRLLRVNREASNGTVTTEASTETTEKPSKPQPSAAQTSVKVKTFEEIMREKRLRKQEMEEQQSSSPNLAADAEPAQKPSPGATLKRKTPAKPSSTPPTTNPPSSAAPAQKAPIRKLMTLKPKAASPVGGAVTAAIDSTAVTAVTSVSVKPNSPPSQMEPGQSSLSPCSPREPLKTHTRSSPASSPTKQSRAAPTSTAAKSAPTGKTQNNAQKKSEQSADTKVRPKLNVKPSVMKPAVKVKPGQKGKAADRSAVAAVKPLNSATKLLQETACKEPEVFQSSTAQLSPAAPHSPSTPECTPHPQSPVVKTPTQSLSRKPSLSSPRVPSVSNTAASTAAVDDFDDLINEFSGDHLGEDMDPSIGEDDLLQELSDMIGS